MLNQARVFFQAIGTRFLAGLVFPTLVALLAVSFADTNTKWSVVREQLASAPIGQTTLVVTVLVAVWTWMAGQALRPVWHDPLIRFLVRQPVSRWQWVGLVIPSVCAALLPVVPILWLIHPQSHVLLHYVVFVGLAWPMVLGASYRGCSKVVTYVGGATVFATMLLTYLYAPQAIYIALGVTIGLLPLGVVPIPHQLALATSFQASRNFVDVNPMRAIIRRDIRCLLRMEWKRLVALLAHSVLTPPMMLAFRINGGVEGRGALLIAIILFSITAATVYNPMERLKSRLGKEVFRLRWPISHVDRTKALVFLIGLLLAPSAALIGVFGSTMGYSNGLVFLLFCLQTVIVCAWLLGRFSGIRRATTGQYLLALVCHGAVVFLVPIWIYIALAAAGIAVGFYMTANLVRGNAITAEIGR